MQWIFIQYWVQVQGFYCTVERRIGEIMNFTLRYFFMEIIFHLCIRKSKITNIKSGLAKTTIQAEHHIVNKRLKYHLKIQTCSCIVMAIYQFILFHCKYFFCFWSMYFYIYLPMQTDNFINMHRNLLYTFYMYSMNGIIFENDYNKCSYNNYLLKFDHVYIKA